MALRRPPFQPRISTYYMLNQYLQSYTEWQKFVPEWEIAPLRAVAGSPAGEVAPRPEEVVAAADSPAAARRAQIRPGPAAEEAEAPTARR